MPAAVASWLARPSDDGSIGLPAVEEPAGRTEGDETDPNAKWKTLLAGGSQAGDDDEFDYEVPARVKAV